MDVWRSADVEEPLIVPDAFTVTSYSIADGGREYRIDISATHDEHDYSYRFRGVVPRNGPPSVRVQRAAVAHTEVATDRRLT